MQPIEAIVIDAAGCLADSVGEGMVVYDDVKPALAELRSMGIRLFAASSVPAPALQRFLESAGLAEYFDSIWTEGGRTAGTIFLTATREGLDIAKRAGLSAVLVMNEPDEAKRLALQKPAGGIVSLHELPDFIRLVAARTRVIQPSVCQNL